MNLKPEYTRFLPHYHHQHATFFVTFRLYNSLPKAFSVKLGQWYQEELAKCELIKDLTQKATMKYLAQRSFFKKMDDVLDSCIGGSDFLKIPTVARCVTEQLDRFDQELYELLAYSIMPNHVHTLLDFSIQHSGNGETAPNWYRNLDYAMFRIKGASARYANQHLNRTGQHFWQPEYHNRYIRNNDHLLSAVDYIKQNPVSAGLCKHWHDHPFTWINKKFW